ncbi:MAG: alpha/beta fold hydrolase [Okeania sp. SIO3B5]|uniref:type I polyketide synthase n=1 Tax=Okeania sp. SIO3B5 TaxID=2607811 RepID=UPI0013FF1EFD|nr:type I polyketide synthase [Okeania sp. SIO3B5]NEO56677.1 alpha/beta fold hydrolase [Okeania sp. SIO3B5]
MEQQSLSSEQLFQLLEQVHSKLETVDREKTEPIAIIGVGCRFPGNANGPDSFWHLLHEGIDAVTEIPSDRWDIESYYDPDPEAPLAAYTRQGSFIQQVDQFDPQFFGISPREVVSLDPQQRLLLEVTWEALENAGIAPNNLKNSKTGVYVGICTDDYTSVQLATATAKIVTQILDQSSKSQENNVSADAYSSLGSARSMAVGRISHLLGLQGPNIQLDTACSSSLVATHLACQSLRLKESNLALVGGVNLILSPGNTVARSKIKSLAPDGRCKTFDASADGYGQGEGCGVVVLKRLSDAMADGDIILATIRGSAINHDGPSSGLTVPNKKAQKEVIQQALQNARVEPHQVSYVEAHGTGTTLGDPIELEALAAIYGKKRPENQPLVVGSVKTNFGHLEAAAGVSSLIKVALALHHQEIPPHLHFKNPNPYIPWDRIPVTIPTSGIPWSQGEKPRMAGVSSFGMSGSNIHIILESAPIQVKSQKAKGKSEIQLKSQKSKDKSEIQLKSQKRVRNSEVSSECKTHSRQSKGKSEESLERPVHLLTLSAKTQPALEELAKRYCEYLENHVETFHGTSLPDICYTANVGRSHFQHRLAVLATSENEIREKLESFNTENEVLGLFSSQLPNTTSKPKIAFLFTGQGSQYVSMGWELYQTQPTFRSVLEECNKILQPYLEKPLLEVLFGKTALIDQTAYTQPALFALEYALVKLWKSWGVQPNIVMGHSVGEYVAATVAGVFSLEEGLKLIATRGKLMQQLPDGGEMVSILASESQVRLAIAPYNSEVAIAAINGPESIVISGASGAIGEICSQLESQGVKTKRLQVSHAFHSPLMEPMLAEFEAIARQITYNQPQIPLISNISGKLADKSIATAKYWVNHIRQSVRFAQSMETLDRQGYKVFLEIGPKPVLLGMGRQCLPENQGMWLPSLRPGKIPLLSPLERGKPEDASLLNDGKPEETALLRGEWEQILSSLAELYLQGVKVDWLGFDQDYIRCKVMLPTYPFQRERYWIETIQNLQQLLDSGEGKAFNIAEKINTPIINQLSQGNIENLLKKLEKNGNLSQEQLKIFPDLLALLSQEYQKELEQYASNNWLYEVQWKPNTNNKKTIEQPCHWLIFADSTGVGEAIKNKLQKLGNECSIVYKSDSYQQRETENYQINPSNPQDFENVYQIITKTSKLPLQKIIHLWSLDVSSEEDLTNLEEAQLLGCGSVLHLLQTVAIEQNSNSPKLWLITRGTQQVLSETEKLTVATSSLWGLGRTIAFEHPQLWGGLLDLDPQSSEEEAEILLQQITDSQKEDHLAVRDRQTYVPRLVKHFPQEFQPLSLCSDATYLITGGLGALGLQIAEWMVEKGARNLVLISRRQPSEQAQQTIQGLEKLDVQVKVLSADISVETDVIKILEQIQTPPLRGVIHAAGVLDDGVLQRMNWERFTKVMAPKVNGAWHLHKLTKHLSLDFFVCFSSTASLLGSPGQGNYAAANAFMDALAYYRRGIGLPGLSINWGAWSESGMATRVASQYQNRMETAGISSISPGRGMQVLEQLVQSKSKAQVGVLPADWSVLAKQWGLANPSSLLLELLQQETTSKQTDEQILDKWKAAPTTERQEILKTYIQSLVAKSMGIKSSKIPADANLIELGMDSLMTMEVVNQLSRDLNFIIYPREFYERPKINSLTQYLSAELNNNTAHQPSPTSLEIFDTQSISPPLASSSERLPGIIFILSSPRSGSTLLRVMLAGHSSLFSPPELHLLPFNTMKERQEKLNISYLGEGLQKAFMEIQNLDATASQTLIQDMESQNLSIQQVYGMMQENIAPRLLVDKSPSYAINRTILERAESIFANSKYIYLVRHPYSVIESFVRMRMQKLAGLGDENPYQIAEQVWVKSNQNILDFLNGLEQERHHQIHYEELVKEPEQVLSQLCDFLNIDFESELLQPYQGERMTEGVHQSSLSISDPNFLKHNTIDGNLADKWKTIQLPHLLGVEAQNIAKQVNYELPSINQQQQTQISAPPTTEQLTMEEKFIEFRGNQICLCSWGSSNAPVVLCIHGLLEQGLAWQEVALPLVAKGYRVVAPDLFGHGRSSHLEMVTSYNSLTFLAQIDRVIQEFSDQPLLLVGHSMGAMLAAAIASVRSELIKRLILVELPLPAEEGKQESTVNQLATCLDYLISTPQHPIFPDVTTAAKRLRQGTPSLSEEFSHILAQRSTKPASGGVCWSWDAILRTRSVLSFNNFNGDRSQYLEMLKSIQVPTTLVYGDNSKLNRPEDLQQQQITMTQAKQVFLPGGHNLHIDAATGLASLILTSQGSRGVGE